MLKNGLAPFALIKKSSFVPKDIEASVDDNLNPVDVMFKSVTWISTSEPVILKLPPSKVILPSLSPNLKLPSPSMKIPLPAIKDNCSASGPIANLGVPLPCSIILPYGFPALCPKLILASAVEIWIVDADTSNFSEASEKSPPSNFKKLDALPT